MCNGLCYKFEVRRHPLISMYEMGFVSCNSCSDGKALYFPKEICIITKAGRLTCPCCLLAVRFSSRCKKRKIVLRN